MEISIENICKALVMPFLSKEGSNKVCQDSLTQFAPLICAFGAMVGVGLIGTRFYQALTEPSLPQAARFGYLAKVQQAITSKQDLDEKDPLTGNTALHFAVANRHLGIVRALLKAGAKVNVENKNYDSILHLACQINDPDLVEEIMKKGASLVPIDKNGDTPLMSAVKKGSLETVKVLLKQEGLNIDEKNFEWKTALALASREYPEIVKALLDKNADANIPDKKGWLPLHHAVDQDAAEIVEALVKVTKDVNCPDEIKNTSLHLTANHLSSRVKSAEILLKQKELNTALLNSDGESALHLATYPMTGSNELALMFIKSKKFDLDLLTKKGQSAAQIALEQRNYEVLAALQEAGAKVDNLFAEDDKIAMIYKNYSLDQLRGLNFDGLSVMEWAVMHHFPSVEKVLNEKGIYFTYREKLEYELVKLAAKKLKAHWEEKNFIKLKEIREFFEDALQLEAKNYKQPELIKLCLNHAKAYLERREIIAQHKKERTHVFLGDRGMYDPDWYLHFFEKLLPSGFMKILAMSNLSENEISLNDIEQNYGLLIDLLGGQNV